MNQNEVSKLIKSSRNYKKDNANNYELETKKNSLFRKFFENKLIIIIFPIILIILILFIITIVNLINRDYTMDIYFELLNKHSTSISLPSNEATKYDQSLLDEKRICSANKKFAIIRRKSCIACGLFSYYIVHLGA